MLLPPLLPFLPASRSSRQHEKHVDKKTDRQADGWGASQPRSKGKTFLRLVAIHKMGLQICTRCVHQDCISVPYATRLVTDFSAADMS